MPGICPQITQGMPAGLWAHTGLCHAKVRSRSSKTKLRVKGSPTTSTRVVPRVRALRPGWSWLPLPTRLRYCSPFRSCARATSLHRGSDGQYRVTVLGHQPLQCFLMPVTGESPGDRAHEAHADPSRAALLRPPAPSSTPPIPIPSPVIPPGLTSSGWPYLMTRSLITALCLWQHCVAEEVPKWREGAAQTLYGYTFCSNN